MTSDLSGFTDGGEIWRGGEDAGPKTKTFT